MKKLIVLLLVTSVLTVSAFAGPTVKFNSMGYKGTYNFGSPIGNVYAGEMKYTATGITGIDDGQFISFCIEANEHVNFNQTYDAILNTSAHNGGIGGPNPDPLSNSTAWLYNSYLDNIVGSSNNTLAKDYQMAIWYLEDEIASLSPLSANAQSLVNTALANDQWENTSIKVLNLYAEGTYNTNNPIYKQDCLVRVTTPDTPNIPPSVPAPGAVLLGSIGAGLVGWIRRRKTI